MRRETGAQALERARQLLREGRPYAAVRVTQRVLRAGGRLPDAVAGELHLALAAALHALGRPGAAESAACDGAWLLACGRAPHDPTAPP